MVFERQGYSISATAPMEDGGLDGLVTIQGVCAGVQCKHYRPNQYVKVEEVRALIGSLAVCKLAKGYFITTGAYSKHSQNEARKAGNIQLLVIGDLMRMSQGMSIAPEAIRQTKIRLNVPQQPPRVMWRATRRKFRKRRRQDEEPHGHDE